MNNPIKKSNKSLFFQGFSTYTRTRKNSIPRVDELPYFLTWPLVYLMGKGKINPNYISFLSFAAGIGFLVGLVLEYYISGSIVVLLLLSFRILLDCMDGQYARYSKQTSNLGALYDLAADFCFAVLLYIAIFYCLLSYENIPLETAILLTLAAFLSYIASTTVASFFSRLNASDYATQSEVTKEFLKTLQNERPKEKEYSRKLNIMNGVFRVSWRLVSLWVLLILIRQIDSNHRERIAHITSFFEYGTQLTILLIILAVNQAVFYFLIFQVLAFCIMVTGLLLYNILSSIHTVHSYKSRT